MRLAYETGATSVRCSLCATVNVAGAPVAHCQCQGCGLTLAYARNAHSVRCAACEHVTPVAGPGESSFEGDAHGGREPPPRKSSSMVVVENPQTLDAKGVARRNMAVGVVCDE